MKDIREFESKADSLLSLHRPIKFRFLLENGDLIERLITPVFVGDTINCYRDQKKIYKSDRIPITDITSVTTQSLRLLQSIDLPSLKTEGNPVKQRIIDLLKMNYIVIQ